MYLGLFHFHPDLLVYRVTQGKIHFESVKKNKIKSFSHLEILVTLTLGRLEFNFKLLFPETMDVFTILPMTIA
jgi:hypothetical protein